MSENGAPVADAADVTSTSSRFTRVLGLAVLAGSITMFVLGIFLTRPDQRINPDTEEIIGQWDAVRLLYVHVPVAILSYISFTVTAVAGVMFLIKRSAAWDILAHSSAEVGVIFTALMLATGSIWGRPVWNTWWRWEDVRIMTAVVMLLSYLGYLAYRSVATSNPASQARNAAIIGILAAINIPIVNKSVDWWEHRTIHQKSTFLAGKFEDLTYFTVVFSIFVFIAMFVWMMTHRFRIGWLQYQQQASGLDEAIAERRAEADLIGDRA